MLKRITSRQFYKCDQVYHSTYYLNMINLDIFLEVVKKIFKNKNSFKKMCQVSTSSPFLLRRHSVGPKPEKKLEFLRLFLSGVIVHCTHSED